MEGAALRDKQQLDAAFWQAWHGEAFARMDGRRFKRALTDHFAAGDAGKLHNASALAFFRSLQAQGIPVKITRH